MLLRTMWPGMSRGTIAEFLFHLRGREAGALCPREMGLMIKSANVLAQVSITYVVGRAAKRT